MGTGGSGPHLARCEGSIRRAVPGGMQGSVPIGSAAWQKSASPLVPESRRHLRQRVVHGRPGQPIDWQASIPAAGEVQGETGVWGWPGLAGWAQVPTWPEPLQSVSAYLPSQLDPGKGSSVAGQLGTS